MGDVVPFRRKRKWTNPEDYGHSPKPPKAPRDGGGGGRPPGGSRWKKWLPALFWVVAIAGITAWVVLNDAGVAEAAREQVAGTFTRCGTKSSPNCVIDGDTIRLGDRSIRLVGIDAPEIDDAKCEAERVKGEAAANALLALVNAGPFAMTRSAGEARDEFGRDLRKLTRSLPGGEEQSFAEELVRHGAVRAYTGGDRLGWCPQA